MVVPRVAKWQPFFVSVSEKKGMHLTGQQKHSNPKISERQASFL